MGSKDCHHCEGSGISLGRRCASCDGTGMRVEDDNRAPHCHDCARLTAEVERLRAEPRWIPTSERLPEEMQDVAFVVYCPNDKWIHGRVLGGRYNRGVAGWFSVPGLMLNASHWMPLPAAPSIEAANAAKGE